MSDRDNIQTQAVCALTSVILLLFQCHGRGSYGKTAQRASLTFRDSSFHLGASPCPLDPILATSSGSLP